MTEGPRRLIARLDELKQAWCDNCLADDLGLPRRQQAQAITGVLEEIPLYRRYHGECASCGEGPKMVILKKR
jgi:hypothetical protein